MVVGNGGVVEGGVGLRGRVRVEGNGGAVVGGVGLGEGGEMLDMGE